MSENDDKLGDLLKKFQSSIENIHDNYASIQNIERQKKIADTGLDESLNQQIDEVKSILMNNQKKACEILDKIISEAESASSSVKKHCKKLKNDFESNKDNPDLTMIREDILLIKEAI